MDYWFYHYFHCMYTVICPLVFQLCVQVWCLWLPVRLMQSSWSRYGHCMCALRHAHLYIVLCNKEVFPENNRHVGRLLSTFSQYKNTNITPANYFCFFPFIFDAIAAYLSLSWGKSGAVVQHLRNLLITVPPRLVAAIASLLSLHGRIRQSWASPRTCTMVWVEKKGYLLDGSLCGRVGRLGFFQQL